MQYIQFLKNVFFVFCCSSSFILFVLSLLNKLHVSAYGILVLCYFVGQILFSLLNLHNNKKYHLENGYKYIQPTAPSVSIIVVGYRENEEYWKNCLKSILSQKYPSIENIIISIDGCEEEDMYMKVIAEEYIPESTVLMNIHDGKRNAICKAVEYIKKSHDTDYFILVDSDTVLGNSAVQYMVECIDQSSKIGCATGFLYIFSKHFLGRVINARYGYAFNIERGAMSYFGVMNCCSGPLSIYRSNIVDKEFLTEFKEQKFLGTICGPGDDRHLTNMVLIRGYESRQTALAVAYTEAPCTFMRFLRQQVRWMRSFYREEFWQIQAIPKQHIFLSIVTQYELLYPFFILSWIIYMFFNDSPYNFFKFFLMSFVVMLIRTTLLMIVMKDFSYIYNLAYLPIYLFFIVPLKIFCFFTMKRMHWITSSRKKILIECDFESICIYSLLIIWNLAIVYTLVVKGINII